MARPVHEIEDNEDSQVEDPICLDGDEEDDEEEEEEELEMFDPQELMDCLRTDEGQTVGDSLALIAKSMETQNKLLVKLVSHFKSQSQ